VIVAEQKAGVDVSHDLELQVAKEPTNLSLRRVLGDTYLKSKSYAKAIEQYDVVLAAKPDDAPVRYNRGVAELGLGANDKAAADLAMEVKENPTDADGWDNLGVALGKQGDWKGAIDAFTHYVNLKPDDISAYHDRGIAEYNMKDYTAAAADLNRYNVAKPGDPEVSRLISDMLLNGAHPEQAIAMIQSQLAKNPKDGLLWFNLGVAQVTTKDYTSAVGSFTHAIELKRDEVTLYNRGFAYYNLGQAGNAAAYPKAEADAAAALALKPAYPEALLLKADAEFADKTPGKMQAAIADYKAYAQMSGLTPDAKKYAQQQALRGAIALKDYAAVVAGATDLIETDPNEASNYLIRGSAYLAQMNYDAAIPDLVKYTTLKSDDATGFYNLGLAYYNKKDNANAGTAFEKALQLKPNYYDAAFQAGVAYQALATADQSDLNKAKPEFEKAVADYEAAAKAGTGKNAADALYNEATTLELEGKAADSVDPLKLAVPVWERYIAAAPNDPELPKIKAHVEALKTQIANG
jgi:tetratricopeptide (TPR) repeat protein